MYTRVNIMQDTTIKVITHLLVNIDTQSINILDIMLLTQ